MCFDTCFTYHILLFRYTLCTRRDTLICKSSLFRYSVASIARRIEISMRYSCVWCYDAASRYALVRKHIKTYPTRVYLVYIHSTDRDGSIVKRLIFVRVPQRTPQRSLPVFWAFDIYSKQTTVPHTRGNPESQPEYISINYARAFVSAVYPGRRCCPRLSGLASSWSTWVC